MYVYDNELLVHDADSLEIVKVGVTTDAQALGILNISNPFIGTNVELYMIKV